LLAATTGAVAPRVAIERAVAQRIGDGVSVTVSLLQTTVAPMAGLQAIPDPAARTGEHVRFQLVAAGERVGVAIATVHVQALHARALRAIARDEAITPDAIELVTGDIAGVAFRHLPGGDELTGLKARRDIAPGEPLTDAVVVVPPLVRSGEPVSITVRVGSVQAEGSGIASGSGHLGDTIHVIQRSSRTLRKARITGPGAVELIP
jgi:flagella basal body P-ring formation protein FlgA